MDLLRNSTFKSNKSTSNKSVLNDSLKKLNKSFKSPIRSSVNLSLKTLSSVKSGINKFDIKSIYENNMQTNLSLILFITIIISYISKKYYIHLGLLFVLVIIIYLITKNLFYALLISIILVNLIMLINFDFTNIINNKNNENKKDNNKE